MLSAHPAKTNIPQNILSIMRRFGTNFIKITEEISRELTSAAATSNFEMVRNTLSYFRSQPGGLEDLQITLVNIMIGCGAKVGNLELLKILIEEFNISPDIRYYPKNELDTMTRQGKTAYGVTALMIAAQEAQDKTVMYLLSKKADPNIVDEQGNTALSYATALKNVKSLSNVSLAMVPEYQRRYTFIVRCLLSKGANPIIQNKNGGTPLMNTMFPGISANLESAKLILNSVQKSEAEKKESVVSLKEYLNLEDLQGLSAARYALIHNHNFIDEFLKYPEFSLDEQNKNGTDLLTFAITGKGNKAGPHKVEYLLKSGATLKPEHIQCAIGADDLPILKILYNSGKFTITQALDGKNRTALSYAAGFGRKEIVKYLLDLGANVDQSDINGMTSLFYAIHHDVEIQITLGKAENLSLPTADCLACVDLLLNAKANVNHYADLSSKPFTPLHYAATHGKTDILIRLLKEKPELNKKYEPHKNIKVTALAISAGVDLGCVQALLQASHESKINFEDLEKALEHAAFKGQKECLMLLLKEQASKNDAIGKMALVKTFLNAIDGNQIAILEFLANNYNVDQILAEQDFQKETCSVLLSATCHKQHKALSYLINLFQKNKLSLDMQNDRGVTALMNACGLGDLQAVKLLIAGGASLHSGDKHALRIAAAMGFPEIVEFLCETAISQKFNINLKDKFGRSAIQVTSDIRVVKILRKFGALDVPVYCQARFAHAMVFYQDMDMVKKYIDILDVNQDLYPTLGGESVKISLFLMSNLGSPEIRALVLKQKLYQDYSSIPKAHIATFVDLLQKTCLDFLFTNEGFLILTLQDEKASFKISLGEKGLKAILARKNLDPEHFVGLILKNADESDEVKLAKEIRARKDEFISLILKALNIIAKPMELSEHYEQSLESIKRFKEHCASMQEALNSLLSASRQQNLIESFDLVLLNDFVEKARLLHQKSESEIVGSWRKIQETIQQSKADVAKSSASRSGKFKRKHKGKKEADASLIQGGDEIPKVKELKESNVTQALAVEKEKLTVRPVLVTKKQAYKPNPSLLSSAPFLEFESSLSEGDYRAYTRVPRFTFESASQLGAMMGVLSAGDRLNKIMQRDSTREKLIFQNATLGALGQALEARKEFDEVWPNGVRNAIFRSEEALQEYFEQKDEGNPIFQKINQNLKSFVEKELRARWDLTQKREKLELASIDDQGFLAKISEVGRHIPPFSLPLADKMIQKSELELKLFREYITRHAETAKNQDDLKQAIGFSLARIGTHLNDMRKNNCDITKWQSRYGRYIPLGCEYRHNNTTWILGVEAYIERCLKFKNTPLEHKANNGLSSFQFKAAPAAREDAFSQKPLERAAFPQPSTDRKDGVPHAKRAAFF